MFSEVLNTTLFFKNKVYNDINVLFYLTIYSFYNNIKYNNEISSLNYNYSNDIQIYKKYEESYKNKPMKKLKYTQPKVETQENLSNMFKKMIKEYKISNDKLNFDLLLGNKEETLDYYIYSVYINSLELLCLDMEKNKLDAKDNSVINKYNNLNDTFINRTKNENTKLKLTQFEYLFGYYVRQDQENLINRMVSNYEKKESKIYQLLMGLGKSSVITPQVILSICNDDKYNVVIVVVPPSLLQNCINNIVPICCNSGIQVIVSDINVNTYDYIKNSLNNKLVYVTTDSLLKKKLLSNVILEEKMDMEKKCMILDEIDLIIDPLKSEHNISNKNESEIYEYSKIITKIIINFIDNFENICKKKQYDKLKYNTIPHYYILDISEKSLC